MANADPGIHTRSVNFDNDQRGTQLSRSPREESQSHRCSLPQRCPWNGQPQRSATPQCILAPWTRLHWYLHWRSVDPRHLVLDRSLPLPSWTAKIPKEEAQKMRTTNLQIQQWPPKILFACQLWVMLSTPAEEHSTISRDYLWSLKILLSSKIWFLSW